MQYLWNLDKNQLLRRTRGIGFEDIILAIDQGNILLIKNHENPQKYPGQKVFLVYINNYVYRVPFIQNGDVIFFKTIVPSRKEKKLYFLSKLLGRN